MATFAATYSPAKSIPTKVSALATTASSAELLFSQDRIIAIVATGNCQVVFGITGLAAADATGWFIPSGAVHQFDLGQMTAIRVYNPTGGNIDVYVMELAKA